VPLERRKGFRDLQSDFRTVARNIHIITLAVYFDARFEKQSLGLQFGYAGVGIRKMRIS
jgi:hypothetical protein